MPFLAPYASPNLDALLMSLRPAVAETRRPVSGYYGGSGSTCSGYAPTAASYSFGTQSAHNSLTDLLQARKLERIKSAIERVHTATMRDFETHAAELQGIDPTGVQMALRVWVLVAVLSLGAERIEASLTPERSLLVRAVLPEDVGTLHVAVLLHPGVAPYKLTGVAEVDDNTLVSVFSPAGELLPDLGADAPFTEALRTVYDQLEPLVAAHRAQALDLA